MNTDQTISATAVGSRPDRRRCFGFTLVELLVVTVICGVLVAAIVACLVGGIRAWDYVRRYGSTEIDAMIRLEAVQRDIANAFRFYGVSFSGDEGAFSFPGLVDVVGDGSGLFRPGTVKFFYDRQKGDFLRKVWVFPSREPLDDSAEKVMSGISRLAVSYYAAPSEADSTGGWVGSWNNSSNMPGAVMLDLTFDGGEKQAIRIRRTVVLPVTALPEQDKPQQPVQGRQ